MEINLLVLNVGNSRLGLGVFKAGTLEFVTRISHDRRADWVGQIADAWKHIEGREGAAVAGACVNPPLIEQLELAVEQACKARIEWVGEELELPITVNTDNPAETGVDRILNVAAAFEQMQKACVVVDAGSAVTVDCCNDKGDFMGGAIAPGVTMMLEVLHASTAKLPRVDFAIPKTTYGRNTTEAIQQGVYHSLRGLVKEVVETYATELGFWPDIIATGGDATKLFEGWELIHAISPDLTLYGIALAFANHHIKLGE